MVLTVVRPVLALYSVSVLPFIVRYDPTLEPVPYLPRLSVGDSMTVSVQSFCELYSRHLSSLKGAIALFPTETAGPLTSCR